MPLPIVNAVWIGRTMGPVHAACLSSFLQTDHRVILHSYGPVDDAPAGVEFSDANQLLPEDRLLRYRESGSYALSANLIRYEIQRRSLGLYVDCDVYCLSPIDDEETIFGRESHYFLNCAVLKLPADSPVLVSLSAIGPDWIPPWNPPAGFLDWLARRLRPKALPDLPWGTTGPRALTWYVEEHGLAAHAKPFDVFYPVPPERTDLFVDADIELADLCTPRTHYVHLYNQMLRTQLDSVPASSPLGRMLATHAPHSARSRVARV